MTEQSQKSFEEWWNPLSLPITHHEDVTKKFCKSAWQASEAGILALLESKGMVEGVARAVYEKNKQSKFDSDGEFYTVSFDEADYMYRSISNQQAKTAIEAIKQKINEKEKQNDKRKITGGIRNFSIS